MRKLSLRSKIVIMTSVIITIACQLLTINSVLATNKFARSMIGYDSRVRLEGGNGDVEEDSNYVDNEYIAPQNIEENQISYKNTMTLFSIRAVLVMIITILVFALLAYYVTGQMLEPLSNLNNSIKTINEKNLKQRVKLPKYEDEVFELTESFNSMMNRLEQSYVAQKNFSSNAAHELKTPLSIMKTSLQVLEMDEDPTEEDYKEFVLDIKQSMDRLIKTVESLLALTNQSMEATNEEVFVLDIINKIIDELSSIIVEKNISVTIVGDELMLFYNKILLYRIFYNLIENAIKYNKTNGFIRISLNNEGNKSYVLIEDNGIGMDKETINNIFQPFFRADLSRSQKIPGNGLGMSIVKTILERYDGDIEVKSKLNEGTSIKVNF